MRTARALSILVLFLPTVVRAQEVVFKILEAKDNIITLQSSAPDFDQALFLINQTDKPQPVTLTISELRASGGSVARIEPKAPPQLAPREAGSVQLTGRLPEVGDFKGLLSVQAGSGTRQEFALMIQRVQGTQQISLEVVPEGPIHRLLCDPDAQLRIRLTETMGAAATFQKPVLTKLLQEASDTYQPGAKYQRAVLTDLEGRPVLRAAATSEPAGGLQAPPRTSTSDQSLAKDDSREFLLKIEKLEGSGKYLGTVRVATPNGALAQTFVLFVKHHWLYAGLAILAGVWASYWLRFWLQVGRPRALKEILVVRFEQEVHRVVPETMDPIRLALEAELQTLRETLLLDAATEVAAELEKKRDILENYRIVKSVIILRGQIENLPQDLIQKIVALDQRVRDGGLEALAQGEGSNALVTEAQEIRKLLLEGAQTAFAEVLAALEANIEGERAALEIGRLDQTTRQRVVELLDQAATHLDVAGKAKEGSGAAEEQTAVALLRQGRNEFDAARKLYLAASIARFRRELELQTEVPLGVEGWGQLKESLLHQLPPDASAEQYAEVRRRYLQAVLEGLKAKAEKSAEEAAQRTQPDAEQGFRSVAARTAEALGKLDQVTTVEVQALQEGYQKVLDSLLAPESTAADPQNRAARATATGAPLPGADPAALPGPSPLPEHSRPVREKEDLIRDVQRNDTLVAWIVSIVSVLLGLSLLWSTNETFGSFEDYIGAILWGFGLHELNKLTMPEAGLSALGLALPQAQAKQR